MTAFIRSLTDFDRCTNPVSLSLRLLLIPAIMAGWACVFTGPLILLALIARMT